MLVVDDSPAFREALAMVLDTLNCTVAGSISHGEAQQTMSLPQVDLVVLGLSGAARPPFELLRHLKDTTGGQIIVCSAHVLEEDRARLLQAGAAGALRKPLDLHAFRHIVNFLRWQAGGPLPVELLER